VFGATDAEVQWPLAIGHWPLATGAAVSQKKHKNREASAPSKTKTGKGAAAVSRDFWELEAPAAWQGKQSRQILNRVGPA
jgi:hypothetical protein